MARLETVAPQERRLDSARFRHRVVNSPFSSAFHTHLSPRAKRYFRQVFIQVLHAALCARTDSRSTVMYFLQAASAALFYVTAITAAPSVRRSIDLVARSQVTLPSGRTATAVVVEGDTDCGDAVGTNTAWVRAHGELYQMTVANSDQKLCEGRLASYIVTSPTYQSDVDLAKRSLAATFGEAHVEKRWNPNIIAFDSVTLIGGSTIGKTAITLGTVAWGFGLAAFAAATWWAFRWATSGSNTETIHPRDLATTDDGDGDSGRIFSNTTLIKIVGGQCTTSTCNGKTPGGDWTFYAVRVFTPPSRFTCTRAAEDLRGLPLARVSPTMTASDRKRSRSRTTMTLTSRRRA